MLPPSLDLMPFMIFVSDDVAGHGVLEQSNLPMVLVVMWLTKSPSNAHAHAGSRTRVTSMGGLYDAATLRAPVQLTFAPASSVADCHRIFFAVLPFFVFFITYFPECPLVGGFGTGLLHRYVWISNPVSGLKSVRNMSRLALPAILHCRLSRALLALSLIRGDSLPASIFADGHTVSNAPDLF